MEEVILNKNAVEITEIGNIDFKNLEPISVKNCSYLEYMKYGENIIKDFIQNIKSSYFEKFSDEKILIDVKFHNLRKNQYPCIPGWHIDGSLLFSKKSFFETYVLYICGDTSFTEFCHDEIIVPRAASSIDLIKQHDGKNISALSSGQIAFYNSTNMHRGVKSEIDGKRLLIRVMHSDIIRKVSYKDSIFQPIRATIASDEI
jgi:hypothetical protein